ncbi:MAG: single-stranded DNA-binding protein, partial [Bacteroidaceae bacterium]|nr:single-stranded DNA-binding protein [Paraprevotella sp.]MDY2716264.1 single-stranded DNA-binding protein [Bacteroidaceae bacterium]
MNKVMLIGNVGKEPEIRYIDKGLCVANLWLATSERGYKTAAGGEVPDRTT